MTALATTRLREFWPDGDPLTLLGLWCLDGSELWDANARARYRIAPYPWDDRARYLQAAEYIDGVGERLLPQLADALDGIHGVSFSVRAWRVIVGPWLTWYLGALYDRYVCIREILDRDPALTTIALDPASFMVPDDFEHFVEAFVGEAYNLQLYTRALEALGASMPRRQLPADEASGFTALNGAGRVRSGVKSRLRAASRRLQEAWLRRSDIAIVGVGLPKSEWLRFWASSGFQTAFCTHFAPAPAPRTSPNAPLREQLASRLSGANEFERFAARAAAADLPLGYLEAFQARAETVKQEKFPRVIVSAVAWYGDERFKLLAAEASHRGSRLLGMPHGGYYGMLAGSSPECHEQRVTDRYYSWGWREELVDRHNVTPLPAMQLARSARFRRPGRRRRQIVLVTTLHPRYVYRFHGHPVGPQWAHYVARQLRLVGGVSASIRQDLIVRLYSHDFGWNVEDAWRRAFPDVRLECGAPAMSQRMRSATLLLIDHPGTTMLEATVAGVPFILCWDTVQFSMRPAAREVFDGLRRAGVLFDSPEAAARHVNATIDGIDAWWQSCDVTAARNALRARFASTSPDWRKIWRQELRAQAGQADV